MTFIRHISIPWICLAILLILAGCSPPQPDPQQHHYFVLLGQSNMAGRSHIEACDEADIPGLYLLDSDDLWTPATHPFNQYSSIRKRIELQRLNPGYSFAQEWLQDHPGKTLGLIVNARGATKIERWQKGNRFYDEAIRRIEETEGSGTLSGILWHQGERNCDDPNYLKKLKTLINSFRTDLNRPELPFVAGQILGEYFVNRQIARLPDEVPQTGCVLADGLEQFEKWHFDSRSMRILGERYAEQVLKLESKGDSVRQGELGEKEDRDP